MTCTSLRLANVYGPRQDASGEGGVVAIFCRQAAAGQPLTITGDGHQTRDFVYVGDVVRAHLAALRGAAGTYHIGTGHQCSILNLAETVAKVAKLNLPVTFLPGRPGEVRRSVLRYALAQRKLGWRPLTPLEEGVKLTFASLAG
jgi:UDP-glucose 4-epimerase